MVLSSSHAAAGQPSLAAVARADDAPAAPRSSEYLRHIPARIVDTRSGMTNFDGRYQGTGAVVSGTSLDVVVGGRGGVPALQLGTVVLNITSTNATALGS